MVGDTVLMADTMLDGLSEADVQHVREKAENLLAEILEMQAALSRLNGPGSGRRKAAIAGVLARRIEEYRPLKTALQNWDKAKNIARSNERTNAQFLDLRAKALTAMEHLQRRRAEAPLAWLGLKDDPLAEVLDDLLEALAKYTGKEPTDWFSVEDSPDPRDPEGRA